MSNILSNPVAWYLSLTILGWLAFPISYRLLPGLKDRGYASSRALGWLVWGYLFWLLASLGVVRNDVAGLTFSAFLVVALSLWVLRGTNWAEMGEWLRQQLGPVLVVEVLFLVAFVAWGIVRAANPEALGTEKPMELAFINAILRSPTFPPHDPWLSGYAISYYYFGYVLVAMLAKLTGTPGAVAFNLGVVSVFALGATGAYGLVYNLLNARRQAALENTPAEAQPPHATLAALLGPLFLLLVSNLQGLLQVLHDRGLFWSRTLQGEWTSGFWAWLDIKDLVEAPQLPFTWVPERYYWWWRASRVLQDYDLAGNSKEIIDEFPFFSFLLSDLHPHVLAIPFGLLAIGLALNLFLGGAYPDDLHARRPWRVHLTAQRLMSLAWVLAPLGLLLVGVGLWQLRLSFALLGVLLFAAAGGAYLAGDARRSSEQPWLEGSLPLHPAVFALTALALGGMAFMNTWDFPVYVGLAAAAFALRNAWPQGKPFSAILAEFIGLGMALGISGILLYLPFYVGFSSQAGGIVPNLIYATRGAHLWVMFGTLLVPIFAFLVSQAGQTGGSRLRKGLLAAAGITLVLWLLSLALGMLVANLPDSAFSGVRGIFLGSLAADSPQSLFLGAILRRLTQPGGWLTLWALLGLTLAGLWGAWDKSPADPGAQAESKAGAHFGLLLAIFGTLLVLAPEFFFLRDMFGWRMNTIFKFYYQAWLLWSILAAYATLALMRSLPRGLGTLFGLVVILLVAAGLVYAPLSLWNKTGGFNPPEWTLDGTAYFARQNPVEMAAINWLKAAPLGVVAEAGMGDAYSEYGRVATFSGQPGVLGWINHENQWRGEGSSDAIGSRQNDLERLYCTRNWDEARSVLDHYNIRYIYIGSLERLNYQPQKTIACPLGLVETKFQRNLKAVFDEGGAIIYEYTGSGND